MVVYLQSLMLTVFISFKNIFFILYYLKKLLQYFLYLHLFRMNEEFKKMFLGFNFNNRIINLAISWQRYYIYKTIHRINAPYQVRLHVNHQNIWADGRSTDPKMTTAHWSKFVQKCATIHCISENSSVYFWSAKSLKRC